MNAMAPNLHQLWVYLAASPLLGLTATLIAYLIGVRLHERAQGIDDAAGMTVELYVPALLVNIRRQFRHDRRERFCWFDIGAAGTKAINCLIKCASHIIGEL